MSSKTEDQLDELKLEDEAQPTSDQGSQGGGPELSDDEDSSSDEFVALVSSEYKNTWTRHSDPYAVLTTRPPVPRLLRGR